MGLSNYDILVYLFSGPKQQTYITKPGVNGLQGARLDTQHPAQVAQRQPLLPPLQTVLSGSHLPVRIWWFLFSLRIKKSQALSAPWDSRTHAGSKRNGDNEAEEAILGTGP